MRYPTYLRPGDTIGMVCPAGFMPAERTLACISTLESWGYQVRTGTTVGGHSANYFSGTDQERLQDLQQMLDDRSIKAILFGRGGYGMGRIIDQLDLKKFDKHPKWLVGYSDITVLHAHICRKLEIATLHAPMAGAFNEQGDKNEFILSLKQALEGHKAHYECPAHPFNRTGRSKGELVGGNLSLLAHLCGTASAIRTKGRILFLEDVGEYIYHVDRMMYQLKRNGLLDGLKGLIIGGFTDMKDTERPFGLTAYETIRDIIAGYDYPVCFDFPVSHTERNVALKVGGQYRFEVNSLQVSLMEK